MSTLIHPLEHILERIMTDALEDHEDSVNIGGRAITNFRFAHDIDYLAGEEEVLVNLAEAFRRSLHSLRHGYQCQEDQADDKQHQWLQHRDQNKWTEA